MRQDDAIRTDEPWRAFRRAVSDLATVAARLGRHAGDGEILITEATYRMVREATEVERLESPIEL